MMQCTIPVLCLQNFLQFKWCLMSIDIVHELITTQLPSLFNISSQIIYLFAIFKKNNVCDLFRLLCNLNLYLSHEPLFVDSVPHFNYLLQLNPFEKLSFNERAMPFLQVVELLESHERKLTSQEFDQVERKEKWTGIGYKFKTLWVQQGEFIL